MEATRVSREERSIHFGASRGRASRQFLCTPCRRARVCTSQNVQDTSCLLSESSRNWHPCNRRGHLSTCHNSQRSVTGHPARNEAMLVVKEVLQLPHSPTLLDRTGSFGARTKPSQRRCHACQRAERRCRQASRSSPAADSSILEGLACMVAGAAWEATVDGSSPFQYRSLHSPSRRRYSQSTSGDTAENSDLRD